jgi:hypothetical protein
VCIEDQSVRLLLLAVRHRVYARVRESLARVHGGRAGEDDVGTAQQFPLQVLHKRRVAGEARLLVGAVVHRDRRAQVRGVGQRRRRGIPDDAGLHRVGCHPGVQQRTQLLGRRAAGQGVGEARTRNREVVMRTFDVHASRPRDVDRLLDHHDPSSARGPHEQVMGALPQPVPAHVREAQQQRGKRGGGRHVDTNAEVAGAHH